MDSAAPYFLGDHAGELMRLEFQSMAWREATRSLLLDAGLRNGHRAVDLGCGPGFLTTELADVVGPTGRVLAIDKSDAFLAVLRARIHERRLDQVSTLQHDIERAPLPYTDADLVISRWLDPYVDDLDKLVAFELRCLKSGGRAAHFGTFNWRGVSMAPPSAVFDAVSDGIMRFYERNGRRIGATGLIPTIFSSHGADIVSLRGISPIARAGETLWEWYRQFSSSMLPRLVDDGILAPEVSDGYAALWTERAGMPGTLISVPSQLAVIAEKR